MTEVFSNLSMSAGLTIFQNYLVVRIVERFQDMCTSECSGCKENYRFASLHPCQRLSLAERVDMFLPRVLTEASDKMELLVDLYHNDWKFPIMGHVDLGRLFVEKLGNKQIFDRRFINEATTNMFPFDDTWFKEEPDYVNMLLDACQEIEEEETLATTPVIPKITKRKNNSNVRNVDTIEMIADIPKKPKKIRPKKC